MARIVVTRRLPAGVEAPQGSWVWPEPRPIPRPVLLSQVKEAEGLLTMLTDRVDEELLEAAPRLRVVSQMAVGVDNIDLGACTARGIPVGHTPDVLTETTADTAFALLAAAVRRLPEGIEHVRRGSWREWDPELLLGGDLWGTTLGVVGLGRIGTAVVRRAAGFRMHLLYTGPRRKPHLEAALGVAYRRLGELLAEADHVVLTLPLTPATTHLIDAEALSLMKPGSSLVNIARGGLIDHDALAEALRRGRPARAALDVTDPEPIPPDHPLVGMPNCLIVPHIGSASVRTRRAMAELAVANLLAGLEGRPLPACANPHVEKSGGSFQGANTQP